MEDFEIDLEPCGLTKGCFRRPEGCALADCEEVVTWTDTDAGDQVEFEMYRTGLDGWVGLGFSNDNLMVCDSESLLYVHVAYHKVKIFCCFVCRVTIMC